MSHLRLRLRPHTSSHSSSSAQTHLTPPTHCLTAPTPSPTRHISLPPTHLTPRTPRRQFSNLLLRATACKPPRSLCTNLVAAQSCRSLCFKPNLNLRVRLSVHALHLRASLKLLHSPAPASSPPSRSSLDPAPGPPRRITCLSSSGSSGGRNSEPRPGSDSEAAGPRPGPPQLERTRGDSGS